MTKVWITNYAGHDFSPAEKYGTLEYITKGYVSFQSLDRVKYHIAESLSASSPDDYLLISGRPIISVLAVLIWFQMHHQVKILNWDQKTNTYREMLITETNLNELDTTLRMQ